MDEGLRALNRFGMGAPVQGEERRDARSDPRGWLESQLVPGAGALPVEASVPTDAEIGETVAALRAPDRQGTPFRQAARERVRTIFASEAAAALGSRVTGHRPFVERLVAFWSNHLCVSVQGTPTISALAGHYERTVVRARVLGRFEDMLLAAARHPAMLVYLDNARSVGPGSPAGRFAARRGRETGLIENYARELLELHTIGVDGGYVQEDVEAAARVLTGWGVELGADTVPAAGAPGGGRRPAGGDAGATPAFVFRPETHEPGAKTVLGRSYGPGGVEEGERLLRDLARHPSTATHLATRLVRHFVADDPPAAAVERIASVWRDTEGDLLEVSGAVVHLDEAWDPAHRKLRSPQDWLVAALRAFSAEGFPEPLVEMLHPLRHPLWTPTAPKGFDDLERAWADPDSLMNRAELARAVARRAGRGLDPRRLLEVMEPDDGGSLAAMLADGTIASDERIALALGGPAFQWR